MKYLEKKFIKDFLKFRYPMIPPKLKNSKYIKARGVKWIIENDKKTGVKIGIKTVDNFVLINPDNLILKSMMLNTIYADNIKNIMRNLSNNQISYLADEDGKRVRYFKFDKKLFYK